MESMRFTDPVFTLLESRPAVRDFGPRIGEVLRDAPYRFLRLAHSLATDGSYPAGIAFPTRDVTTDSGKTDLAASLLRFHEILWASPGLRWHR